MMRKINYGLIGDKIKIDTNYYYMTPKVNFSNDTITELKQKLEFNNLCSGKWMFLGSVGCLVLQEITSGASIPLSHALAHLIL